MLDRTQLTGLGFGGLVVLFVASHQISKSNRIAARSDLWNAEMNKLELDKRISGLQCSIWSCNTETRQGLHPEVQYEVFNKYSNASYVEEREESCKKMYEDFSLEEYFKGCKQSESIEDIGEERQCRSIGRSTSSLLAAGKEACSRFMGLVEQVKTLWSKKPLFAQRVEPKSYNITLHY